MFYLSNIYSSIIFYCSPTTGVNLPDVDMAQIEKLLPPGDQVKKMLPSVASLKKMLPTEEKIKALMAKLQAQAPAA